jgi:GDP-D-mannose dehydratase
LAQKTASNGVALITGATGQDGAYLAELLLKKYTESSDTPHHLTRAGSNHLYQDPHEQEVNFALHYGVTIITAGITFLVGLFDVTQAEIASGLDEGEMVIAKAGFFRSGD